MDVQVEADDEGVTISDFDDDDCWGVKISWKDIEELMEEIESLAEESKIVTKP